MTRWADAWNEYLKKGSIHSFKTIATWLISMSIDDVRLWILSCLGLNFVEYGLFKGSMDNGAIKCWSALEKKRMKHRNRIT